MNNIIIGAIDMYTWDQVQPWAASIRESGFDGDVYLILYRGGDDILAGAEKYNINVYQVELDGYGQPIQYGTGTQSHNMRFYHAWELLTRLKDEKYFYCVMTDVRDVIFQNDPFEWFFDKWNFDEFYIAPTEGVLYSDEPWNAHNFISGFGELMWELHMKHQYVCNVGTIGGKTDVMRQLFLAIHSMTEGRRYYPSDQSSFGLIVSEVMKQLAFMPDMDAGWAAQLGTTMDPEKAHLFPFIKGPRPTIKDGVVVNSLGKPYVLVHQWDRVPELKNLIPQRYA